MDSANVFRADVIDIATNSIILQVVGDEDKIAGLVKMCEPYGIRELTRTGRVAMVAAPKTTTVHDPEPERIASSTPARAGDGGELRSAATDANPPVPAPTGALGRQCRYVLRLTRNTKNLEEADCRSSRLRQPDVSRSLCPAVLNACLCVPV